MEDCNSIQTKNVPKVPKKDNEKEDDSAEVIRDGSTEENRVFTHIIHYSVSEKF